MADQYVSVAVMIRSDNVTFNTLQNYKWMNVSLDTFRHPDPSIPSPPFPMEDLLSITDWARQNTRLVRVEGNSQRCSQLVPLLPLYHWTRHGERPRHG